MAKMLPAKFLWRFLASHQSKALQTGVAARQLIQQTPSCIYDQHGLLEREAWPVDHS